MSSGREAAVVEFVRYAGHYEFTCSVSEEPGAAHIYEFRVVQPIFGDLRAGQTVPVVAEPGMYHGGLTAESFPNTWRGMKRDGRRLMYFVPPADGTFAYGTDISDRIPSPSSQHRFVIGQRNNLAVPEMEFRLLGDTLLQRWAGACAQVFERTGDWTMAHRTSQSTGESWRSFFEAEIEPILLRKVGDDLVGRIKVHTISMRSGLARREQYLAALRTLDATYSGDAGDDLGVATPDGAFEPAQVVPFLSARLASVRRAAIGMLPKKDPYIGLVINMLDDPSALVRTYALAGYLYNVQKPDVRMRMSEDRKRILNEQELIDWYRRWYRDRDG
ncbi:MAG: hypothetical protein AB1725_04550 [Armatimonadota bacterium]